jgi:hypothetical protein
LANAPAFSIPSTKKKTCRGQRATRIETISSTASDAAPRFRPGDLSEKALRPAR